MAAAALLVFILAWFGIQTRSSAERRHGVCANALRQVFVAIASYDDKKGHLPRAVRTNADGAPLYSWRLSIAPFLYCDFGGINLDVRWDDPANAEWRSVVPPAYCFSENADSSRRCETNVVAVTGTGTAFDSAQRFRLADIPRQTGLVIEIANSGIHWMEPGDLRLDRVPGELASGIDGQGVHILFADGAVWFLRRDVPIETLMKFFTIEGARANDRDATLRPYLICSD